MKIITLGNSLLRQKAINVPDINDKIIKFVSSMFDVMYNGNGIGLAANQVGELTRIFITHVKDDKPRIFINPEIIETSIEEIKFEEGCLSIPGINADVIRPFGVKIQAWNEKGRPFTLNAEDLLAIVIQHELDHLNGKLFIDHVELIKREKLINKYEKENK